jgi:hypothetical protein
MIKYYRENLILPKFLKESTFVAILISLLFSHCQTQLSSNGNDLNTLLISRLFLHKDRIRILGQALLPGMVANATVSVFPIPSKGFCADGSTLNTSNNLLTSGKTNAYGQFELSYISVSKPVCIVVTGDSSTSMSVYIPFSNATKVIQWEDGIHFSAVIQEPDPTTSRGVDGVYKFLTITPLASVLEGRFNGLRYTGSDTDKANLERANKDMLTSFLNGLSGKIEELGTTSETYRMRIGGITQISDTIPASSSATNANGVVAFIDIYKMIEYMKYDFSDGIFNGLKITDSGSSSSVTYSNFSTTDYNTFLSVKFKNAVTSFLDYLAAEDLPSALINNQKFCDNSFSCL